MTTEKGKLKVPPQKTQYNQVAISPNISTLPYDVSKDLNKYSKIYITKEYDMFRKVHWFENFIHDYKIYGQLPDGDKKLLFTCSRHFQCNSCCEGWGISCCCCYYICCDKIVFQMDYRRNNIGFYTQGFNLVKGFHCTKCECCVGCCPQEILYLRENIDPESPDINVGIKKGYTANPLISCDRETNYYNQNGSKGYGIRAKCCDILLHQCLCFNADFEIDIENDNGLKVGSIMIYSGCCSKAVEGTCCYLPRKYFEINTPIGATSEQKFQIIADAIHFDLANRVL